MKKQVYFVRAEVFFFEPEQVLGCEKEEGYWAAALIDPRGREYAALKQSKGKTKQNAIDNLLSEAD